MLQNRIAWVVSFIIQYLFFALCGQQQLTLFRNFLFHNTGFHSPSWPEHHTARTLRGKTFEHDVAPQARHKLCHQTSIILEREGDEVFGMRMPFVSHPCTLDYLQLMQLQACYGQLGHDVGLVQHHLARLARKSQYQVDTHADSMLGSTSKRIDRTSEVVATTYTLQGGIVARFYAHFKSHRGALL